MIAAFFILCRVLDGLFKLSSELFGITIKVCLKTSFNLKVVVAIVNVDVVDILWLYTRGCKYNLSALGTYFECDGIKCTYSNFT